MSSIDERIVAMKFDNRQFEQGIKSTMLSLDSLNKALKFEGASKGLSDISAATKGFSLAHISDSVDAIANKFRALSVVAITALANIANRAVNTGITLAKSLTIDPIRQGMQEYETTLNSVQTILANTQWQGTGIKQVNDALQQLNTYSDKTIYNFSEMARNIGTFTAAGVKLDTSVQAIKGIANLAAISGSNSQQASTAMYQLSQAIATGTVHLMDWNSVVNAGMGGKVFQDALKQTARVHGVAIDDIIKKEGSFRDSLKTGWLSSAILTETLNKFTGDMTAKQLKQLGYTDKQIKEIQKLGKTAQNAATKVKTISQLISTLQEAAGSGWAQTWQLIFGDFDEAKVLFTNVNNVLGGFIANSAKARNKVLSDWKQLGGRTALIDGISNAFHALINVIKPIRDAFREIFPAKTGKQLADMSKAFRDFTKGLIAGKDTMDKIKRTFAGVFAALDIGWQIIKGVLGVLGDLFHTVSGGSGGFLDITAKIGDFLVKLDNAIKKGKGLTQFFDGLSKVLQAPIKFIGELISYFAQLFDSFSGSKSKGLDRVTARFDAFGRLGQIISTAWNHVIDVLKTAMRIFQPIVGKFSDFFANLGNQIQQAFSTGNFNTILDTINTGLFAGLVLLIRKFMKNGLKVDLGGGLFDKIRGSFKALTGTLTAMQQNLKANVLLKIAGALALLTASVVALSLIDSDKLTKALAAMTVMFTQLMVSMQIFTKIVDSKGFIKMPIVTAALIALAIAIDLLTISVVALSKLSWEELAKGLIGVTVLIGALVAASKGMQGQTGPMIRSAAALILMAIAIKILASAVTDLSGLSWEQMAKGLISVGVLLGALALFTKFAEANKGGLASGAGILLMAVGIKILASAVQDFATMSWGDLAKGLAGVGGGLLLIGAALNAVPPSSILSAAAIFVVAASLGMIADALQQMSGMTWGEIAKGIVTLAGALTIISVALGLLPPQSLLSAAAIFVVASSLGMIGDALTTFGDMGWEQMAKGLIMLAASLGIIAVALTLMSGTLAGSAALLVAAFALRILTPVLQTLGAMSWEAIVKGLVALAGVFVVLGLAGLILEPVIPAIFALSVAIALLGVGLLAAGAGVFLFAAGFTALVAALGAGIGVIIGTVKSLLSLIPYAMEQLALGLVAFAHVIAASGPAWTAAMVTLIMSLLTAINKVAPAIIKTIVHLMSMLLAAIVKMYPKLLQAGLTLLVSLLNGIANNIDKIVTAATNVITNFLKSLQKNLPRITDEGVKTLIAFINGLADAVDKHSEEVGAAGGRLATAMITGMVKGLAGGVGSVTTAAKNLAKSAFDGAMGFLKAGSPSKLFMEVGKYVVQGFVKGIEGNRSQVTAALDKMARDVQRLIKKTAADSAAAAKKLEKLRKARHKDKKAIAAQRAILRKAASENDKAVAAYAALTKQSKAHRATLLKDADAYAKVAEKLKDAQKNLEDATKTRDDFAKSIHEQFGALPDIQQDTSLTDYEANLRQQISDTIAFARMIQELRTRGISDALYRELLAKGTAALPFMQEILDGGQEAVDQLNDLGKQLDDVATGLGSSASTTLYQAAVDAAQGIVDGLKAQEAAIQAEMDKIALGMVKALKKALGIKSPSKVFFDLGQNTGDGLVQGLDSYSKVVAQSASSLGSDAILAMQKSISGLSEIVDQSVDLQPTITPILDLSEVQKSADKIGTILTSQPLFVDPTNATTAANGYNANIATRAMGGTSAGDDYSTTTNYTQNNYSPKALTPAEIYRQTKNQLSIAKGALTP